MNQVKIIYQKIFFFLKSYYYLIFKSSAENYLKISPQSQKSLFQKELQESKNYKQKLSLYKPESKSSDVESKPLFAFSSYFHLKRFQKKIRFFSGSTVALAISIAIFLGFQLFGILQIKGATFGWNQTDWSGGADTNVTASHISNQENWNKFYSKDVNIDTSTAGEVKISGTNNSFVTTSDADFNAGTQDKTYVSGDSVISRKPIGGSCSDNNNCISYSETNIADVGWCNAEICSNPWISGPCVGIVVYRVDLGQLQWKTTNSSCDTPQCGLDGGQDEDTFVVDNSIDFSLYPARNACKSIGGRLPTTSELQCIYTNKDSYDDFGSFQSSYYWSATEYSTIFAWYVYFFDGSMSTNAKTNEYPVRCVKGQ